jgi:FMN phosphatase YigB (HAD superfamily)
MSEIVKRIIFDQTGVLEYHRLDEFVKRLALRYTLPVEETIQIRKHWQDKIDIGEITPEIFVENICKDINEVIKNSNSKGLKRKKEFTISVKDFFKKYYSEYYFYPRNGKRIDYNGINEGLFDFIENIAIRNGALCYIFSNNPRIFIDNFTRKHKRRIDACFQDRRVYSYQQDIRVKKPDPEFFIRGFNRFDLDITDSKTYENMIYFDDQEKSFPVTRAMGITSHLYGKIGEVKEDNEKAFRICRKFLGI